MLSGGFKTTLIVFVVLASIGIGVGSALGDDSSGDLPITGAIGWCLGAGTAIGGAFLLGYMGAQGEARTAAKRRDARQKQKGYDREHAAAADRRETVLAVVDAAVQDAHSARHSPPPVIAVLAAH